MLCVYLVVCFFPLVLLLVSSCFVAIVRIRSTMLGSSSLVHLLHGLDLLPRGISGKMTVYPGSHYYHCYASFLDALAMSRFLPLVYQASQYAMNL